MPSNSILAQKQKIVADLAEQMKNSAAGVIVNYQGITVEADTAMRKAAPSFLTNVRCSTSGQSRKEGSPCR